MKRVLLIITGFVALSLGAAGIFLPLLPTTPFLLLASACFLRSSGKFYRWLYNNKLWGRYLVYYQKYGALTIRAKVISIAILWITILTSALLFISNLWVKGLLIIIAIGVTIHLLMLKTLTEELESAKEDDNSTAIK